MRRISSSLSLRYEEHDPGFVLKDSRDFFSLVAPSPEEINVVGAGDGPT